MARLTARLDGLFSGWRKAGLINTILIWTFSIILVALLLTSAFRLGSGWASIVDTTVYFEGHCPTASRTNLVLHVALNAVATLVLASSNFFMQVLCSPTRQDIDKAHNRAHCLEIGVQSVKNLRSISASKLALWLLLGATSVPLHLFFNGVITESRASTDFALIIASESFLKGGTYSYPGVGADEANVEYFWDSASWDMMFSFVASVASNASGWENVDLKTCLSIYDNPGKPLTTHRNVVMITHNEGETATLGWNASAIRQSNFDAFGTPLNATLNSLWAVQQFERTEKSVAFRHKRQNEATPEQFESWDESSWIRHRIQLEPDSGTITPPRTLFRPSQPRLKVDYCLSEPFFAPCQVQIQNDALLVVFIFCLVKGVVCLTALLRFLRHNPLITPGDAVESFITIPDPSTEKMCWVTGRPKGVNKWYEQRTWARGPRQWISKKHRLGSVVPWAIWIFSYLCICFMLGIAIHLLVAWWDTQPLSLSIFGPDAANGGIAADFSWEETSLGSIVQVNLPQLGLSIAYLAYNGLFTRMISEREWASFGLSFRSLRVSHPKGSQKSTYRLQLPYRWSVPLMAVSGTMHWLVSNCAYKQTYVGWNAIPPYNGVLSNENGVGFSLRATLITFVIGATLAFVPLILGMSKISGNMVVAANNSAVISAACHSIPTESVELIDATSSAEGLLEALGSEDTSDVEEAGTSQALSNMSIGKLKWGVVTRTRDTVDDPGHLAFGTTDQDVRIPVDGNWYAGVRCGKSQPTRAK